MKRARSEVSVMPVSSRNCCVNDVIGVAMSLRLVLRRVPASVVCAW
jgi:hypothetical protein